MRIGVFGTGGVGGYFGGKLAQAGEEVIFIARGGHLKAIQEAGLQVESLKGDFHILPAQATDAPQAAGIVDCVLVGVKAWQIAEAAQALKPMVGDRTVVVPLQNGVEAPKELAAVLGAEHVLGGLCKIAAQIVEPGHIRHMGLEPYIAFGEIAKGANRAAYAAERVRRLREAFERAGVRVETPEDIQAAIWEKFLFIAAISGVGAVTRAPVGEVRALAGSRRMLERVMEEVYAVALAKGVKMADDILAHTMAFVDGLPPGSMPSMMRDIMAGRPSELEYQNGAVVRMGQESGTPTPVNDFIYSSLLPQERRARGAQND
jgi:2-dehydropantoate 2-reductase